MRKNVMNVITIMVVVFFVGLFGFMAGSTADETVCGKETAETDVVTELDNMFWLVDDTLKVMK